MNFDYNSTRKDLKLPEYGRNIQIMVDHVKTIEDREERNQAARTILAVMGNLNPHLRDVADFKHKLWDHLAIMADFDLDIDSPYELPKKEKFEEKPNVVHYNQGAIKYKHYGKTIQKMIDAAADFEEGQEKDALIKLIANQMKKSYLTWNRDTVADEQIFKDLYELSGGKIKIEEGFKLYDSKDIMGKKKKRNLRKK
jgi:hypothetical protein